MCDINKTAYALICSIFLLSISCIEKQEKSEDYFQYDGRVKYDPKRFSSLPEEAPLNLNMRLEKMMVDGKNVLNMQFELYNPTGDTIFLTAAGGGAKPHFEFVVTKLDSMRVWNRRQTNSMTLVASIITLPPSEGRQFKASWDYTDYDGNPLPEGTYLVYGGMYMLSRIDGIHGEVTQEFGDVGVGPDTLLIKK